MSKRLRRRFQRSWSTLVALGALAAACRGDDASSGGSVCPTCDPEVGGETGDFGGTPTVCEGLSNAVLVERADAIALGFDVEELERRVARPIDMPMRWTTSETAGGGPATGFATDTRISAKLSSTGVFHHVRVDPALCDGTTCRRDEHEVPQGSCDDRLELGVRAELRTLDGALQAATEGVAVRSREGSASAQQASSREPYFTTRAALSEVTGTLRLAPRPGAFRYRTLLIFYAYLLPGGCKGELSPTIMVEDSEETGTLYHPLYGSFPPNPVTAAPEVDAGAKR